MPIINETCDNSQSSQPKNLGGKKQCIEGAALTGFVAKNDFYFDSIEDAKNEVKVKEAIQAKNIVPLPEFETVEDENTEPTTAEKRTKTITTKEGIAGSKYGIDAAMCTYSALKTYQDSDYTRIFEITDKEEMTCDIDDEGKVWGRDLTSTIVGLRTRTNLENDASVSLSLKFDSDEYSILNVPATYAKLEGIFDVTIEVTEATSTSIKFKVLSGCSGRTIKSLEDGDVILNDASGATQSITFVAADPDGVYTITGTGFANDFTLGLNGVVAKTEAMYETPTVTTVTGI